MLNGLFFIVTGLVFMVLMLAGVALVRDKIDERDAAGAAVHTVIAVLDLALFAWTVLAGIEWWGN